MPHRDRNGPTGKGPMTGRRTGYCAGYEIPEHTGRGSEWGYGRRFGWKSGRRRAGRQRWADSDPVWTASETMSREQDVDLLKAQARDLRVSLQSVTDRLDALENNT